MVQQLHLGKVIPLSFPYGRLRHPVPQHISRIYIFHPVLTIQMAIILLSTEPEQVLVKPIRKVLVVR